MKENNRSFIPASTVTLTSTMSSILEQKPCSGPLIHLFDELNNYKWVLPTVYKASDDEEVSMSTVTYTLEQLSKLAEPYGLAVYAIVEVGYDESMGCSATMVYYLRAPASSASPLWAMIHVRTSTTFLTYRAKGDTVRQMLIRTMNDRPLEHHELLKAFEPTTAMELFNRHFEVICCPNTTTEILGFMV